MTIINTDYSTRDLQEEEIATLEDIDTKLANPLTVSLPTGAATESTLASLNSKVIAVNTGAVTVASSALPSGAATSAKQDTAQTSLSSIDSKLTSPLTINLPTGASTAANQTTGNSSLSSIDTKTPSLGQALAASSVPVVLTAAQITTLTPPAAISGFSTEATLASLNGKVTAVNTGAVVVSSSALPSGASTSALQSSGNASLTSIDTKTPALGQALAAASVPVVLTASQLTTLTPPAAITGFSTESTLSTVSTNISNIRTSVASIDTKTPALGQALAAGSVPVVLTAAQLTTLTPPAAITGYSTEATLSSLNSKVTAVNTGAVVISSSALPTGAATETTLSALNNKFTASALADAVANPTVSSTGSYGMVFDGTNWNRQKAGITIVASNIGGMINVLPMGRYNGTSPPSLSTGDSSILQMDTAGNLRVNTLPRGEPVVYRNQGVAASANVKASSGYVYALETRNLNASIRYLQLWNTTGIAGTGSLLLEFTISASAVRTVDHFFKNGILFNTGIAFGHSTTSGTYTAGTAADQVTQILYV